MNAIDASNLRMPSSWSPAVQATQSKRSQQLKPRISPVRRAVLYVLLCLSMFFESFNLSALFAAIPVLRVHYSLSESEAGHERVPINLR
ncbi:hypothetical protein PHLGIDRAFT_166675 [Phlebiopsis gigantea 11061_1 CR5-6]|uniref:Uncharacterized protein n=1 Tax=Phlebiopsis gigantea (strain 11061_1 CR5-6) TaxID=745531 RepID=A0A0C3S4P1_PHLG1|nr:hypothetical protein PHLGIDRAFT_166675 [Phlebiopsis gigantea 11061_1 CR5-6]